MARKTFISYKYSEAQNLRDSILGSLGENATYYQGETADSPDLTDTTTDNIKENLKRMIHGTSVTIIVVSPNMIESEWIDWEVEYSLKEITREDKTSRTNGVVGVIMKFNGSYDWLKTSKKKDDGCTVWTYDSSKIHPVIKNNRYNLKGDSRFSCKQCKCYNWLNGSYVSLIEEDTFLGNPDKFIEGAYQKSEIFSDYDIIKQI
jgi:hypothetical protein